MVNVDLLKEETYTIWSDRFNRKQLSMCSTLYLLLMSTRGKLRHDGITKTF